MYEKSDALLSAGTVERELLEKLDSKQKRTTDLVDKELHETQLYFLRLIQERRLHDVKYQMQPSKSHGRGIDNQKEVDKLCIVLHKAFCI